MKWKRALRVLCNRRIPIKLKEKSYESIIWPAVLFGTECWSIKKQHVYKMNVVYMRMLKWISVNIGFKMKESP